MPNDSSCVRATQSHLRTVVIVQRRLTHYRVPLFQALRTRLAAEGIRLRLLHGDPTAQETLKQDEGSIDWAERLPTQYFGLACWQPLGNRIAGASLVILTQENSLLYNHWLIVRPRGYRLAFWGHGANLQSDRPGGVKERFKRWTSRQVDWWFVYTALSRQRVTAASYPRDRVTVLDNAVDTTELRRQCAAITEEEKATARRSLGIGMVPVAVFIGSLYPEKRLPFVFEAATAIRNEVPDFQLLIIGDGPERELVRAQCRQFSWIHWLGTRKGGEKATYLSIAQVMLNPGVVGLGILDSFAGAVPLLTTECEFHGPEIAYLENGVNGIMTANSLDAFVPRCTEILIDESMRRALAAGCVVSARRYTLENMVANFTGGIINALAVE